MTALLENIWLKIAALVMGLLLWFHVVTEKTYHHQVRLPITEITLGDSLTLSDQPPDSITVGVSATGKQLLRRKWRASGIRINATQFQSGRFVMNLNNTNTSLASTSQLVILDEVISPNSITLSIDLETTKQVDVLLNLVTESDEGFAVSSISGPDPPQVTAVGARSQLRRRDAVSTTPKELTGLRSSISIKLPLQSPEGSGIRLSPDTVSVDIEVVPVKTRVFDSIPIVVYNAPPEAGVSTRPTTVNIELTGPPDDIDLLNRNALVASADFRLQSAGGFAAVKIECPSHFRVREASVDSVRFITE